MTSGEGSVYLVKDRCLPAIPPGEGSVCVLIKGQELKLLWNLRPNETTEIDPKLYSYFREPNVGLLRLTCNLSNVLEVHFYKKSSERLNKILSNPYIQFHVKTGERTMPTSDRFTSVVTVAEKRFNLDEILVKGTLIHRLVTSDVLGWDDKLKPVIEQPQQTPKKNQIKISRASFARNLLEQESTKDLTIIAGNGAEVKCHRMIFEAHSDVLAAMISPQSTMLEATTGRVEMMENSEIGITQLVQYLYGMELAIPDLTCDIAVELFKTAHKYKLLELEECLVEMFLNSRRDYFSADDLLELYFHVKNLEEFKSLREYAFRVMMSLSKKIRVCEGFKELTRTDVDTAMELVWKFYDMKK